MTNGIRKLLNIKDPNLNFSENCVEQIDNKLYIKCTLTYPIDTCPYCHSKGCTVKNGTRSSRITYLETAGQACYLLLKKQRFLCRNCCHTFTA